MHPIQLVSNRSSIAVAYCVACVASLGLFLCPDSFLAQMAPNSVPKSIVLDLTAKIPAWKEGRQGIPGAEMGGLTGPSKSVTTPTYPLSMQIEIISSSVNSEGDFIVDVMVRNTGAKSFEFPSSQNLTEVEKTGNKSQRIFFFLLQPLAQAHDTEFIGSIPTGGSTSVPGSFTRVDPGQSLRVLLPAAADQVRGAFKGGMRELLVRVVCHEWQLEDDRYFIRARSDDLPSGNAIKFVLRDGKPILMQP